MKTKTTKKTAQAPPMINAWWEDGDKLKGLIRWMDLGARFTDATQVADMILNPHKYNRQYEDWQASLMEEIAPENPTPIEFFDDRFYPINGQWLESSSTILWAYPSPFLTQFIGNVGTAEAELRKVIAGERGSRVHDALQKNLRIERGDFDDEEWLRLMYARQFYEQYKPELVLNEEVVWDVDEHYAGRLDRVVRMNGKLTLIDFKTGFVSRESWLQLASYKNALEKTKSIKVVSWGIVSLKAQVKAGWKYYPIEERTDVEDKVKQLAPNGQEDVLAQAVEAAFQYDFSTFKAVHAVWRDAFRNMRPRLFPFPPPSELDLALPVSPLKKAGK